MKRTWILFVLSLTASGCSPLLYSPPPQMTIAGAPATVKAEQHAIAVQAGESQYYEDTPSTFVSGQYRYGLTEPSELVVEASAVFIHTDQIEPPVAGLFSAGFKHEIGTPHVSTTIRTGLGVTPLGSNVSADLVLSAGYENAYVVPYFNARIGISQPLHASTVLLEGVGENDDRQEWHRARGALLMTVAPGVEFRFEDAYLDVSAMLGHSSAFGPSAWDIETERHIAGGNDGETHAALSLAFGYKL